MQRATTERGVRDRVKALRALTARACVREIRQLDVAEDPDASIVLLLLMGHRAVTVRLAVLEYLDGSRLEDVTPAHLAALTGLTDPDARVRAESVFLLALYDRPEDRQRVRHCLADEDDGVRWRAAMAVAVLKDREAYPILREMLRSDPSVPVRTLSAESLRHAGDRSSIPCLEAALVTEQDGWVRMGIISALYALGQDRRWRELLGFLREPGPPLPMMAISAIENHVKPRHFASARKALEEVMTDESARYYLKDRARLALRLLQDGDLPLWPIRAREET